MLHYTKPSCMLYSRVYLSQHLLLPNCVTVNFLLADISTSEISMKKLSTTTFKNKISYICSIDISMTMLIAITNAKHAIVCVIDKPTHVQR